MVLFVVRFILFDKRMVAEAVNINLQRPAEADMAYQFGLLNRRQNIQLLRIERISRPSKRVHIDVTDIKRGHILEEMRPLARINPKVG